MSESKIVLTIDDELKNEAEELFLMNQPFFSISLYYF